MNLEQQLKISKEVASLLLEKYLNSNGEVLIANFDLQQLNISAIDMNRILNTWEADNYIDIIKSSCNPGEISNWTIKISSFGLSELNKIKG